MIPAVQAHKAAFAHFADSASLPIQLVAAIITVESAGDSETWNPEPHYRYLVDARTAKPFRTLTREERASEKPPADFPNCPGLLSPVDAEWWGQQASWGLMQVMGAVAREHGYKGNFPGLCTPQVGLKYGIRHLSTLRNRFLKKHGWEGVVAAYNTGGPNYHDGAGQVYVNKVRQAGGFSFKESNHV